MEVSDESDCKLCIGQYQKKAQKTDKKGGKDLAFPLLGLVGEVGSLLSEFKKEQRDKNAHIGGDDSLVEEIGDILWYLSNLATRAGIELVEIGRQINKFGGEGDIPFVCLQPNLSSIKSANKNDAGKIFLHLAGDVGKLVNDFLEKKDELNKDVLSKRIETVFSRLIDVANAKSICLAQVANENIKKIYDRWPQEKKPPALKEYPALFDKDYNCNEQIPRRIEMEIFEETVNDKNYVFQRCKGINIGDRLTDNNLKDDDYRFHDAFHLSYAAILGWSPVIRALFRVKRKSNPSIDDSEDGARAIIVEESISNWIFNYATQHDLFNKLESIDYSLLKNVRLLVKNHEPYKTPLWVWEEAIIKGYEVFRALKKHRGGHVIADLDNRTITFEKLNKKEKSK